MTLDIFTEGWRGQAILVTGSREWSDEKRMRRKLKKYPHRTLVIHGDARGADRLAHELCDELRLVPVAIPYLGWAGKGGGPLRNKVMLDILLSLGFAGYAIEVVAFHPKLSASKGTKDMVKRAKQKQVRVTLIGGK